jgi:hypothetical protein
MSTFGELYMTATTFEQWWELMEREPLTYEYEYAKEGGMPP